MKPGRILHDRFDRAAYFRLADELLEYTKKHLTTKAIATHFLRSMGAENATTVFITVYWQLPDHSGLIHGLAALGITVLTTTGASWFNYPKLPHNTSGAARARELYAAFPPKHRNAGHMYGMKTDRNHFLECGNASGQVDCLAMMKAGKVDVYAYCVSGDSVNLPFYNEWVRDHVAPNRVALMDGEDQATSFEQAHYQEYCRRGHVMFTREMREPLRRELVSPRLGRAYEGITLHSLKKQ